MLQLLIFLLKLQYFSTDSKPFVLQSQPFFLKIQTSVNKRVDKIRFKRLTLTALYLKKKKHKALMILLVRLRLGERMSIKFMSWMP